jgi:EAL domain-containing protein (putative c-di-GMP-specific phosphodiesterase class I)
MDGRPVLEFQPAVDLATGRLLGFEALLRWDHPRRGLIGPGVLIPWAEANDHIDELNGWVLAEACRQAAAWPSGIQLAVNCSLVQLRHQQASVAAARALQMSGLHPDRLTVEVTESAVADERASRDLRNLVKMGVHLAVDDVGTSWTTLENLRRFAIETAKIDRLFIARLEPHEGMNRAIVEAIIHVSHSLAMSTVAEGVETAQQVATLVEFGADVAQGFFFAPPMTSADTMRLATTEPRPVFAMTARRDGGVTTPAQPKTLTVVPDSSPEPRDTMRPAGSEDPLVAPGG